MAAYGVVANTSLVAAAVFNGVSQGSQPLLSDYYGRGQTESVRRVVRLGVVTALVMAVLIFVGVCVLAEPVTAVFNHEGNAALAAYAVTGLRLYFAGFLFAGFNIVGTGILSAVEAAGWAFAASISRGFVSIIVCAFVLAAALGMSGVWLAFPAAELITAGMVLAALRKSI